MIYQTILWLRYGAWTPLEMHIAWQFTWRWLRAANTPAAEPNFSWLGFQKIAVWILEGPLSGGLMTTGLIVVICAVPAVSTVLRYPAGLALLAYLGALFLG